MTTYYSLFLALQITNYVLDNKGGVLHLATIIISATSAFGGIVALTLAIIQVSVYPDCADNNPDWYYCWIDTKSDWPFEDDDVTGLIFALVVVSSLLSAILQEIFGIWLIAYYL